MLRAFFGWRRVYRALGVGRYGFGFFDRLGIREAMSERSEDMGAVETASATVAISEALSGAFSVRGLDAGSGSSAAAAPPKGRAERRLVADAPLGLRRVESAAPAAARRRGSGRVLAALDASLRMLARPLAQALRDAPPERREPRLRAD